MTESLRVPFSLWLLGPLHVSLHKRGSSVPTCSLVNADGVGSGSYGKRAPHPEGERPGRDPPPRVGHRGPDGDGGLHTRPGRRLRL